MPEQVFKLKVDGKYVLSSQARQSELFKDRMGCLRALRIVEEDYEEAVIETYNLTLIKEEKL